MRNLTIGLIITLIVLISTTQAAIYECSNCADCSGYIQNSSAGDTIELIQSISKADNYCINLNDKNNIIFDCQNNFIEGNSAAFGIFSMYGPTNNNTIKNCNISKFGDAIWIKSGSNYIFDNITTTNNSGYGIVLYPLGINNNNSFFNVITNSNNKGLFIGKANNNNLINITANNNVFGIIFDGFNNTLTNIKASSNSEAGITISSYSNYNVINDSVIKNNLHGISFHYKSKQNGENVSHGTDYNLIYNNYFNNTINTNIYYGDPHYVNMTSSFNTTKTIETNILGGSWIGGNFWANPNGTGFSDNCTDSDSDGICDSPYMMMDNNYDYLPLSSFPNETTQLQNEICVEDWEYGEWSDCVGEIQVRSAWDANECGTSVNRSALTQSCYADIPGGSTTPQINQTDDIQDEDEDKDEDDDSDYVNVSKKWAAITSATNITMKIEKVSISAMEIRIDVKNPANNVEIVVVKHANRPAEITHEVTGTVYQYLEINHTNLKEEDVRNSKIKFRVNKSWTTEKYINISTMKLSRYHNNTWNDLSTEFLGEDQEYYIYEAETPGFSVFAIKGNIRFDAPIFICDVGMMRCQGSILQQCNSTEWITTYECEYGCFGGSCMIPGQDNYWTIGIAILIVVVAFLLWKFRYKFHKSRNIDSGDLYEDLNRK